MCNKSQNIDLSIYSKGQYMDYIDLLGSSSVFLYFSGQRKLHLLPFSFSSILPDQSCAYLNCLLKVR